MGLKVLGLFVFCDFAWWPVVLYIDALENIKMWLYILRALFVNEPVQKYGSLCLSFRPGGVYSWDIVTARRWGQHSFSWLIACLPSKNRRNVEGWHIYASAMLMVSSGRIKTRQGWNFPCCVLAKAAFLFHISPCWLCHHPFLHSMLPRVSLWLLSITSMPHLKSWELRGLCGVKPRRIK